MLDWVFLLIISFFSFLFNWVSCNRVMNYLICEIHTIKRRLFWGAHVTWMHMLRIVKFLSHIVQNGKKKKVVSHRALFNLVLEYNLLAAYTKVINLMLCCLER